MKRLTILSQAALLICVSGLYVNCGGLKSSGEGSATEASVPTSSPEQIFLNQSKSRATAYATGQLGSNAIPFTQAQLENQIQQIEALIADVTALDPSGLPDPLAALRQEILNQLNSLLASLQAELAQVHTLCPQLPSVPVIAGFLGINSGIAALSSCPPVPCVKVIAGFLGIVNPVNCPTPGN